MRSKKQKRLLVALGIALPLLGASVLVHTRAGQALLGSGGCPLGKDAPSAASQEEQRVKTAATLKGGNWIVRTGATLNRARQSAGFTFQMKAQA